jgi:MarR family transcriptional regulator, lower aerobic nicotinate degradation pathway regulator
MNYQRLRLLLSSLEEYEATHPDDSKEDDREVLYQFGTWLAAKNSSSDERLQMETSQSSSTTAPQNGVIVMFLGFVYKYLVFYSRRVFRSSPLYALDDFGVLMTLYSRSPTTVVKMSKADVMRLNILEKSSGNEVVKRLLRQGFLEEEQSSTDKRSKNIALTAKGRAVLEEVLTAMNGLSNIAVGTLNDEEKSTLLTILHTLHRHHKPIFESKVEAEIMNTLAHLS